MISQLLKYEVRNLTKEELYQLIDEAPELETRFLKKLNVEPYNFFNNGLIVNGLIIDKRPIYIAMLKKSLDGKRNIFWTIVNSNVKDKISLCKYVRRELKKWIKEFKEFYATMHNDNSANMKWVSWLGFRVIAEDDNYVTYKLGE